MFANRQFYGNISKWNVSNVVDMCGMFDNSKFYGDLSKWTISSKANTTNMLSALGIITFATY